MKKSKIHEGKEAKMIRKLQGQTIPDSSLPSTNLFLLSQTKFPQMCSSRSQRESEAMKETHNDACNLYTLSLA